MPATQLRTSDVELGSCSLESQVFRLGGNQELVRHIWAIDSDNTAWVLEAANDETPPKKENLRSGFAQVTAVLDKLLIIERKTCGRIMHN